MEKENIFKKPKVPSTRYILSITEAIIIFHVEEKMDTNNEIDLLKKELNKLPIEEDKYKLYVKENYNVSEQKKIFKKARQIIKEKNNKDKKIKEQQEKIREKQIHKSQTKKTTYKIDSRFKDPKLIEYIYEELEKDHRLDHKEKLAVFLISATAELPDPSDHVSTALKGDSSAGKDNVIKTAFKHFPEEDNYFLTRATTSSLEEEAEKKKRFAFSEINHHRENGANSDIVESFKQLSEGGFNIIKRDPETGYTTTKKVSSEQKTCLYGTTETQTDDELETRYVIIPIKGTSTKNQIVVNDTLEKAADINFHIEKTKFSSWIAAGVHQLKPYQVIIPFAPLFKEKIKDTDGKEKHLFDYSKERIKRDSKRLLSITRAVTWLYQHQRIKIEKEGQTFLISEPTDFLLTLTLFADFFNLTYSGLDHRLQKTLELIKSKSGQYKETIKLEKFDDKYHDWVIRSEIQKELNINSVTTIKEHISKLKDFQMIETFYDKSVNVKTYLIRPVTSPVSHLSLPVSLIGTDRYIDGWTDRSQFYKKLGKEKLSRINYEFIHKKMKILEKNSVSCEKTDGSETDGSEETQDTLIKNEKNKKSKPPDYDPSNLLDVIKFRLVSTKSKVVSTADVSSFSSLPVDSALEKLREHAKKGDVIEIKPDFWGVVE